MDYSPTCEVNVPGRQPHGPGWFLISSNGRVEVGPFAGMAPALYAAAWLEDNDRGVNPGPWEPIYSRTGLIVGSRYRNRPAKPPEEAQPFDTGRVDAYSESAPPTTRR